MTCMKCEVAAVGDRELCMISNNCIKNNNWSCWSLAGCDPVASWSKTLALTLLKTSLSDDQYLWESRCKLCACTEAEDMWWFAPWGLHSQWKFPSYGSEWVRVNMEMSELTVLLDVAMIKSISWQSSICTTLEGTGVGQSALKLVSLPWKQNPLEILLQVQIYWVSLFLIPAVGVSGVRYRTGLGLQALE